MTWGYVAMGVGTAIGGYLSADAASDAADSAASAQIDATRMGIDEQRRQFEAIQALLKPYADAGYRSLGAQGDLVGLNGADAQRRSINAIEESPQFAAMLKQGENAILQNASATGGLRGGNTQAALAEFRPKILSDLIERQFGRLGGFTSLGQNSAAGVGNAGMQTGNAVTQLLGQQGAAQAGGALAAGRARMDMYNSMAQGFGTAMSGMNSGGGGSEGGGGGGFFGGITGSAGDLFGDLGGLF